MSVATPMKVGGKELRFSNLDKPLFPSGFTKGQVIEYYLAIAPVMLPHLRDRAVTLKRYPNGSDQPFFFEKNCPAHRPPWMRTAHMPSTRGEGGVNHCVIQDKASLLWAANLAALELHVPLAKADDANRPTAMAFDLDPGPPATLVDCIRLGLRLREMLQHMGLDCLPKTSGSKGLHVYVPLNTPVTFEQTKSFALAVATIFAKENPAQVTSNMSKAGRAGKIFIDWSQNDLHKTTVCVYSLRARDEPLVSTPVTWKELEASLKKRGDKPLRFTAGEVLKRVEKQGDLFAALLKQRQRLPAL